MSELDDLIARAAERDEYGAPLRPWALGEGALIDYLRANAERFAALERTAQEAATILDRVYHDKGRDLEWDRSQLAKVIDMLYGPANACPSCKGTGRSEMDPGDMQTYACGRCGGTGRAT